MEYASVVVENGGSVGIVTLNRPGELNAMNGRMLAELTETMMEETLVEREKFREIADEE